MSIRHFDALFRPRSLALIGAGNRPGSIGQVLMRNVLAAGFAGEVFAVNPKYPEVAGKKAYPDVESLPFAPDLAVFCAASVAVPATISALGARGCRAAVVISAGFSELGTPEGKALEQAMLAAAKPWGLRIIGPNCVGVMVPGAGLNASFAHLAPAPGRLAFVSQSGALCTAILDDVAERDIGFSHFISLGNCADVDFGDMLDYLAGDPDTSAILLYIESVGAVRKFMSAGRAAARNKPVIVIKSGRNQAGAKAAASHTGALIGADAVYDVAFKRAGMLRVYDMEELFDAVETLARIAGNDQGFRPVNENGFDRLAIISNGGGPAVLATDHLVANGGALAECSDATLARLNAVLPATWSHGNPVDIIGDADAVRYGAAVSIVAEAPEADALLVMKCPTAVSDNLEAAEAVIDAYQHHSQEMGDRRKLLLTCWLGAATARASRQVFAEAGIASYETPEKAVRAFLHVDRYRHNQLVSFEVPPAHLPHFTPDKPRAEGIIARALAEGRTELFEHEAKWLMECYAVPVTKTLLAADAAAAARAAEVIGYPVVVKVVSRQISHKSDVGGVVLDVADAAQLKHAIETINNNVERLRPEAVVEGFSIQPMVVRKGAYELILGMSTDRQFGPVLMFGEGGVAVEVIDDKALGLPPINARLAREMIASTRVYQRLKGFRDRKPVALAGVVEAMLHISQLVTDFGSLQELDINPLLADADGVIALDARVTLAPFCGDAGKRLTISAYPAHMEEIVSLPPLPPVVLRPVRPEDGAALAALLGRLEARDLFQRFHGEYPALVPAQSARLTQVDYEREIVFVAVDNTAESNVQHAEIYGCIMCMMQPGQDVAEFTVVVRPDRKGAGLGSALVRKLLHYLGSLPHIRVVEGVALSINTPVIAMLEALGFTLCAQGDGDKVKISKIIR